MSFRIVIPNLIKKKITQDVFFLLFGNGLSQGLVLLSNLYVARFLGIENYGKLGIIQSTLAFFGILSGTTFSLTPQKYIAELLYIDKKKTERILGMANMFILSLSLFIALFMIVTSKYLAIYFLHEEELSSALRISSGILFCNSMFGAQSGILAGFKRFKIIGFLNLFRGILMLPFMLLGGKLYGLTGVLIGTLFVAVIVFIVAEIQVKKSKIFYGLITPRFREYFYERKFIFTYTLPTFVGGLITMPVIWWSNTKLINVQKGFEEMAIFSMANTWRLLILFIPSVINQPFMSFMSSFFGSKNFRDLKKYLIINIVVVSVITMAVIFCIFILSNWIVEFYGKDFISGKSTLIVLSISAISASCAMTVNNLLFVIDRVWVGVFLNGIWSILFFLILMSYDSINALNLSWAYFGSYFFHFVLSITVAIFLINSLHKSSVIRS